MIVCCILVGIHYGILCIIYTHDHIINYNYIILWYTVCWLVWHYDYQLSTINNYLIIIIANRYKNIKFKCKLNNSI